MRAISLSKIRLLEIALSAIFIAAILYSIDVGTVLNEIGNFDARRAFLVAGLVLSGVVLLVYGAGVFIPLGARRCYGFSLMPWRRAANACGQDWLARVVCGKRKCFV